MSLRRGMMMSLRAGEVVAPLVPKGNAIKFSTASGQGTESTGSGIVNITNNFTLKFWVRMTSFGSQYVITTATNVSIIFGYTGPDWPAEGKYFEFYGGLPRTPFNLKPITDSNWHEIEAGLADGFLWGKIDGDVAFTPVAYGGSLNMPSTVLLATAGADLALGNFEMDNLELYVNGELKHRYNFNENTGEAAIDDVSGANLPASTATRVLSTIPD